MKKLRNVAAIEMARTRRNKFMTHTHDRRKNDREQKDLDERLHEAQAEHDEHNESACASSQDR